jgi:Fe-S-cluster containining protein
VSDWFAGGLRFECTRCGNCCTGSPGYVWLAPRDEQSLADFLALSPAEFRKRYTRLVHGRISLVEKPGRPTDCVFLTDDKRCSVNDVKPRQCLTFPFWPRILASEKNWDGAAESCPGIGDGPLYKPDTIRAITKTTTPRELVWKLMGGERR